MKKKASRKKARSMTRRATRSAPARRKQRSMSGPRRKRRVRREKERVDLFTWGLTAAAIYFGAELARKALDNVQMKPATKELLSIGIAAMGVYMAMKVSKRYRGRARAALWLGAYYGAGTAMYRASELFPDIVQTVTGKTSGEQVSREAIIIRVTALLLAGETNAAIVAAVNNEFPGANITEEMVQAIRDGFASDDEEEEQGNNGNNGNNGAGSANGYRNYAGSANGYRRDRRNRRRSMGCNGASRVHLLAV